MKKSVMKKEDQDKKMPDPKTTDKIKRKKKSIPVKEEIKPRLPVSDSNSGYIPFGG